MYRALGVFFFGSVSSKACISSLFIGAIFGSLFTVIFTVMVTVFLP
jgi:hypothetical protein